MWLHNQVKATLTAGKNNNGKLIDEHVHLTVVYRQVTDSEVFHVSEKRLLATCGSDKRFIGNQK